MQLTGGTSVPPTSDQSLLDDQKSPVRPVSIRDPRLRMEGKRGAGAVPYHAGSGRETLDDAVSAEHLLI